jgi:cytochrome c-type biogenesis protein CcmF
LIGNLILQLTLLIGIALLSVSLSYNIKNKKFDTFVLSGFLAVGLLSTAVVSILIYYFFTNYNVNYVFTHSSVATPWYYKISAAWAGQEGTFILWSWVTILSALFLLRNRGEFYETTATVVLSIGIILLLMAYAMEPFKTTMSQLEVYASESGVPLKSLLDYYRSVGVYDPQRGFIDGSGMNPLLMSPWMALHPPIVFIAYATLAVPFSAALVHLVQRKGDWEEVSRPWLRFSWLFLTLGISIGGFWAYEELSYGGYWVWDPVETSSLIPWISLTGLLHASPFYRKARKFSVLGPALALFTLIFVFYATYITRSGVLKSVHGYASSPVGPYLAGFIIIAASASIWLILREMQHRRIAISLEAWISAVNLQYLAVILFITATGILIVGITYPVVVKVLRGIEIPVTKEFFNKWSFPVINLLLLLMGFCILLGLIEKKRLYRITGAIIVLTFLITAASPASIYFNSSAAFLIFALGGVGYKVLRDIKDRGIKIKKLCPHIIHIGIAILMLGIIISNSFEREYSLSFQYPADLGTGKKFEDYVVKFNGLDVVQTDGNWVQLARVEVLEDADTVGEAELRFVSDIRYGRYPKVSIIRGLSDLYIVFYGYQHNFVPITIKIIPGVCLIWIGGFLMCLGMVLSLLVRE